jgi:plasmid stabilization system protein ParE
VRTVEFHPEAEAEFISAAVYYEDRAEGLGLAFISAVERAYQRILEYPEIGRRFGRRLRRVLVPGFPYGLLYRVEPQDLHRCRGTPSPPSRLLAIPSLSRVTDARRNREAI